MGTFVSKPTAKIQATYSGSTSTVTIDGVTAAASLTAENSVTQINKVLDVVGKSVVKSGIKRIIVQEEATE
ncbi:MAG: hypothetical protein IJP68_03710 [Selenomonadaceae bacterium]|nr:hypothetical protein [Selenomonadaceae bacterium]